MIFIFITVLLAQPPMTESQNICLQNAYAKNEILNRARGQCSWQLPSADDMRSRAAGYCSAYETVDNKQVKKKTTYTGSGHLGHLICGSPHNEKENSYKEDLPRFTYQCSECSTSDSSGVLDEFCIKSMLESERSACMTGAPLMQYKHPVSGNPVPIK